MGVAIYQPGQQRTIGQLDVFGLRITGQAVNFVNTGQFQDPIVFDDDGVILQYFEALIYRDNPVGLEYLIVVMHNRTLQDNLTRRKRNLPILAPLKEVLVARVIKTLKSTYFNAEEPILPVVLTLGSVIKSRRFKINHSYDISKC